MSLSECDIVLAGRYHLEGRIASGGMGEVWRAADTVLERPVAVKLLRAEYSGDPDTLARFRAEARHAAAMSHPGIAHVYDYREGGPDGSPFLVMELVDGPALTELLAHGPLDAVQSLDVVAQAAAALAAAHAAGLVHRDIKPGNLLVAPGGIVKITDFGIAYAAGSAPLTRTGALIGTPAYLAPERVAGAPATPASDLYSLGIVAYECLAGTPPFNGSPMQIALAHQRRAVPPLAASVPRPLARFVSDLTARNPAARPGSAADVAARARYLQTELSGRAMPGPWQAPVRPLAAAASGPRAARDSQATFPAGELAEASEPTVANAPTTMPDAGIAGTRQATGNLGPQQQASGQAAVPRHTLMLRPSFVLRRPGGTRRPAVPRLPLALAAAAVALIAALAGWLLAGGAAGAPQHAPASSPAPASRTVDLQASALVGMQVRAAEQRLGRLGLSVSVKLVPTRRAPAGTVLAVRPSGQLQPGAPVILTVATSPPGHHHHDGGQGGDDGGSGDGGGPGDGGPGGGLAS
jgi:eukaryotic-like serine/threonine-protein kinase